MGHTMPIWFPHGGPTFPFLQSQCSKEEVQDYPDKPDFVPWDMQVGRWPYSAQPGPQNHFNLQSVWSSQFQ